MKGRAEKDRGAEANAADEEPDAMQTLERVRKKPRARPGVDAQAGAAARVVEVTPVAEPSAGDAAVRAALVERVDRYVERALGRMDGADVMRAVAAQSPAETLAEIMAAAYEPRDDEWSELLLRGAAAKGEIARRLGGLLSSSEAAAVLGITVPGVKLRMQRGKLLAAPLAGGQWVFPGRQFTAGGAVRGGVAEVAATAEEVDAWTVLSILADEVEDDRGGTLLERLDEAAVLADVLGRLATFGTHGAA